MIHKFGRLYSVYSIIKCWLYYLCCTICAVAYFILYRLYLLTTTPVLLLPPPLSPLVTTNLFSISTSLLLSCYILWFAVHLDST